MGDHYLSRRRTDSPRHEGGRGASAGSSYQQQVLQPASASNSACEDGQLQRRSSPECDVRGCAAIGSQREGTRVVAGDLNNAIWNAWCCIGRMTHAVASDVKRMRCQPRTGGSEPDSVCVLASAFTFRMGKASCGKNIPSVWNVT